MAWRTCLPACLANSTAYRSSPSSGTRRSHLCTTSFAFHHLRVHGQQHLTRPSTSQAVGCFQLEPCSGSRHLPGTCPGPPATALQSPGTGTQPVGADLVPEQQKVGAAVAPSPFRSSSNHPCCTLYSTYLSYYVVLCSTLTYSHRFEGGRPGEVERYVCYQEPGAVRTVQHGTLCMISARVVTETQAHSSRYTWSSLV